MFYPYHLRWSDYLAPKLALLFIFLFMINPSLASSDNFPTFTLDEKSKISLVTLELKKSPKIDGVTADNVWSQVELIGEMHQIFPAEYQEAHFRNQIKVSRDKNNLYIMANLYDDDIKNISRNAMSRGQNIRQDDFFGVILDPFNDKTNGYYFSINANGFKEEGLIANNRKYMGDWDGIWHAKTSIHNEYWSIEIAIPFKSLSFNQSNAEWGINFVRQVKQPEQTYYWSSHGKTPTPWAPEHAGKINNMSGISQGIGLDLKLSASIFQQKYLNEANKTSTEPSLDITFKPTPAMTTSLTFNTDFSATEIDQQQINLTRFSLFTPEKRDFFLQGADIFEFGDISANAKPFFSRKMGLSTSGSPLSINLGSKITGQLDNTRFAFLAINQDLYASSSKTNTLAVSRLNTQLNNEFSAGFISTYGDPNSENNSWLLGIDGQYRNKSFFDGQVFELKTWAQTTINERENKNIKGDAYSVGLYFPNELLNAKLAYSYIGRSFDPRLGFINRTNIEQIDGWLSIDSPFKGRVVSSSYHTINFDVVKEINGSISSKYLSFDLVEITTMAQNYLKLSYKNDFEHILNSFLLVGKLTVPSGKYQNSQWQFSTSSDRSKLVSYGLQWLKGSYFHGDVDYKAFDVSTNINRFIKMSANISARRIAFPENSFTIKSASFKLDIAFSPDLFWNNWFQYNNVSNELSIFSRLVWQQSPLNAFNLVINQNYIDRNELDHKNQLRHSGFKIQQQDTIIKMSYLWRF